MNKIGRNRFIHKILYHRNERVSRFAVLLDGAAAQTVQAQLPEGRRALSIAWTTTTSLTQHAGVGLYPIARPPVG